MDSACVLYSTQTFRPRLSTERRLSPTENLFSFVCYVCIDETTPFRYKMKYPPFFAYSLFVDRIRPEGENGKTHDNRRPCHSFPDGLHTKIKEKFIR